MRIWRRSCKRGRRRGGGEEEEAVVVDDDDDEVLTRAYFIALKCIPSGSAASVAEHGAVQALSGQEPHEMGKPNT